MYTGDCLLHTRIYIHLHNFLDLVIKYMFGPTTTHCSVILIGLIGSQPGRCKELLCGIRNLGRHDLAGGIKRSKASREINIEPSVGNEMY